MLLNFFFPFQQPRQLSKYFICIIHLFSLSVPLLLLFALSHLGFNVDNLQTKMIAFLFQKRQTQPNSKSRSEKFNPHPEEVASGFPIDPPRPSQVVEATTESQGHHHKRASHSGPLSHQAAWAKAAKNPDDAPKVSTGADLSSMSGLVAARRSLLSEDRRDRSGSSQQEVPKLIARFPGSFKETSESLMQQDQKDHSQGAAVCHQKEDGSIVNNDPIMVSITGPYFPPNSLFYRFLD